MVDGIYMCVLVAAIFSQPHHLTQVYTPSWEYFITLDLEWEVIRGRRPHGWTFWVSDDRPFVLRLLWGGRRADFCHHL